MVFPFALALAAGAVSFLSGRSAAKKQKRRDDAILAEEAEATKKKKASLEAQRFLSLGTGVQKRSKKSQNI